MGRLTYQLRTQPHQYSQNAQHWHVYRRWNEAFFEENWKGKYYEQEFWVS